MGLSALKMARKSGDIALGPIDPGKSTHSQPLQHIEPALPSFSLLGGLEVRSAQGHLVTFPTRKTEGLLAYLAISPGMCRHREQLATMFWGHSADTRARNSLRQALYRLRSVLSAHLMGGLDSENDSVCLRVNTEQIDVLRFERLVAEDKVVTLETALAIYRGDFLEGFKLKEDDFEEWLMLERLRLQQSVLSASRRLLDYYVRRADAEAAIRTAHRSLAFDALQEDVHRTLMSLYVQQDHPASAVKQYVCCRDLLRRELGIQPSVETRRLAEKLGLLRSLQDAARRDVHNHHQQMAEDPENADLVVSDEIRGDSHRLDVASADQCASLPDPSLDEWHQGSVPIPTMGLGSQQSWVGKREAAPRQLTILVCELVDAGQLSAQLEGGDMCKVLANFQYCCQRMAARFGGCVIRYTIESVQVCFRWHPNHQPRFLS